MAGPPPTAFLQGGPCDGTTRKLTAAELHSGTLTCKGATYNHTNNLHGSDVIFKFAAPPSSGGTDTGAVEPHTHTAWHDLQRSVNKRWPDAIDSVRQSHKAALRSLARARKVRP